jgi:hypothetical protein
MEPGDGGALRFAPGAILPKQRRLSEPRRRLHDDKADGRVVFQPVELLLAENEIVR